MSLDASPDSAKQSIVSSLNHLGLDYVDLYYIHRQVINGHILLYAYSSKQAGQESSDRKHHGSTQGARQVRISSLVSTPFLSLLTEV